MEIGKIINIHQTHSPLNVSQSGMSLNNFAKCMVAYLFQPRKI